MLSQFCIRRPIFASVMSILIVLAGLVCMRVLPLSQYPDISPPSVSISTSYEGADAQTLARTIAAPIEDQLSGVEGLQYYTTSIRSNGDVRISCTFEVGIDPNDAMLEINNRVRTAERRLPETVRQNGVTVRKRSEETLLMMALTSPDGSMNPTQMADYATLNIVDDLKRIPGVGPALHDAVYSVAASAFLCREFGCIKSEETPHSVIEAFDAYCGEALGRRFEPKLDGRIKITGGGK